MTLGEGYAPTGNARRRAELEQAERAERRREAQSQLAAAVCEAEAGDVKAMRRVIALLAVIHNFKVETREVMPTGAVAFSNWRTRTIVVPPIKDEITLATALHEAGHILAGECTGREPHRRNPQVTDWWHCQCCENNATENALQLFPLSRAMFEDLSRVLKRYRRRTPACAAELNRADRLAGDIAWREDQLRRLKWRMREELVERWKREVKR